jgi:hypothetical protein
MSSQFFTLFLRVESAKPITPELMDRCQKQLTEEANRISRVNEKLYVQSIAPHSLIVKTNKTHVLSMSLTISFSGELRDPVHYDPDNRETHFYEISLEATP